MRRKEREITDPSQIRQIIQSCSCCRVGFYDNGEIYIVPLSFGYLETDGSRRFYFHGAAEGRKASLIRQTPKVGFELDSYIGLVSGENACSYSARFQSVTGVGRIRPVEDAKEKKEGLLALMRHYTNKEDWAFPETSLSHVQVYRLDVESLSCKANL